MMSFPGFGRVPVGQTPSGVRRSAQQDLDLFALIALHFQPCKALVGGGRKQFAPVCRTRGNLAAFRVLYGHRMVIGSCRGRDMTMNASARHAMRHEQV